ncbi:MAG: helix-turn-helix transcriptional regulator [Bacteroides sp.]
MKIFLYEKRTEKAMSIRTLSAISGVAKSHIERIEAGETNPTISVMCKLAKALDISVGELFSCD